MARIGCLVDLGGGAFLRASGATGASGRRSAPPKIGQAHPRLEMVLMGHAGRACRPVAWLEGMSSESGRRDGGGSMREGLDHRVHDAVALAEIDLYAEVLSAVAAADRPLTAAEIDAV